MKRIIVCLIISLIIFMSGCQPTPEDTEIVVSDAITSNGDSTEPEIIPNATVYQIEKKEKQSFFKFILGKKLSGMQVEFYARPVGSGDDAWIQLGDAPVVTDSKGKASIDGLRKWLAGFPACSAPLDLQLRADVLFSSGKRVSDTMGLIRVLSSPNNPCMDPNLDRVPRANQQLVISDHDNTIHATGGLNSIADVVNFLNFTKGDWPLIDEYVVPSVKKLHDDGKDLVIVTGMPLETRALCRQQMINHFEPATPRSILIFVKDDMPYKETFEYKAATLGLIKKLYGDGKALAMVGDTPHEDGYGAMANGIFYIPFKVNYFTQPLKDLDTQGFGFITPDSIAWDWSQVMAYIDSGDTVTNRYLRNDTGFLNIAHRGGAALMPENTLEAFRNGMSEGADGYELDLQLTKDGVIVVSHDTEVDRCTDGTGSINDKTLEEVQALDAGYKFTTDGGATYPYRGQGIKIPTLEEVLNEPALANAVGVIEIKQLDSGLSDKLLDIIEARGIENKVIIESFDTSALADVRKEITLKGLNIITSFNQAEIINFFLTPLSVMLAARYDPPAKVLQVPLEFTLGGLNVTVINDPFMFKARYLGLKVHAWTINEPSVMRSLINDKKVEAIMTDEPGILKSVINE
jgi:glycerophosphoryl diester phosphodiesterase